MSFPAAAARLLAGARTRFAGESARAGMDPVVQVVVLVFQRRGVRQFRRERRRAHFGGGPEPRTRVLVAPARGHAHHHALAEKLLRVRGEALRERVEIDLVPHVVRADRHGVLPRTVHGRGRACDRGRGSGTRVIRVGFGSGRRRRRRRRRRARRRALSLRLDVREGCLVRHPRGGRRGGGERPAPALEACARGRALGRARRSVRGEWRRGRRPPGRRGARTRASRECRRRGLGERQSERRWAGGRGGGSMTRGALGAPRGRRRRGRGAREHRA